MDGVVTKGGATAGCADGRVVTGGFGSINNLGRVMTRRPAADGSGFLIVGQNAPLQARATVKSTAFCIDRPAGYTVVQTNRTLGPRERAFMDITCPAGTVVIGGGALTSSYDVYMVSSAPKLDGSAWTAYFRNDVLFGSQNVEGYAVCADSSAIAGREVVSSPPIFLGAGSDQRVYLNCPAGKKPLSIGLASSASTVTQGLIQYKMTSTTPNGPPPPVWEGWINNTSGLDNVTAEIRLLAICATAN